MSILSMRFPAIFRDFPRFPAISRDSVTVNPYIVMIFPKNTEKCASQSQKMSCDDKCSKIEKLFQKKKKIVSPHFFPKVFCAENRK